MREKLKQYKVKDEYFNSDNWKAVTVSHLPYEKQQIFNHRKNAIDSYLSSDIKVSELCQYLEITYKDFYKLLNRCFTTKEDGSIFGYEALIPGFRIKTTHKKFTNFINQNLLVEEFLDKKFKNYKRNNRSNLKKIHALFLKFLKGQGFNELDYPFTLSDKGYKPFCRYYSDWSASYLNNNLDKINTTTNLSAYSTRPLEEVEVDGHRIDAYFITEFQTPSGTWREAVIERPWLLCTIDRSTRSILGYHLVLKSAYDADDVITCIEKSIIPQEYSICNNSFDNDLQGGLPNTIFPDVEYALFDELYLDNAMAHLANHTINTFVQTLGIKLCFGKVAEPTRRGIIERFFKTLEENSFHCLPSTTGSRTDDIRRTTPEKNARKYRISVQDLEDILQLTIFQYNAKGHQSLFGNSPLEDFKQKFDMSLQTYLPISLRSGEQFHIEIETRKVVSNSNNAYLHINYSGAKYTNPRLSKDTLLKGKTLSLHINRQDLRTITAFYPNGQLYGDLVVEKKWRGRKHSLKERQLINKLSKEGVLSTFDGSNIIEDFDHYLFSQEKPNKRTSSRIAEHSCSTDKSNTICQTKKNNREDNNIAKSVPDPVELTKNRRKSFKIKSINL